MLGYVFVVEYKKGKDNLVADALSRKVDFDDCNSMDVSEVHKGVLCMISFSSPAWLIDLKASYTSDQQVQDIFHAFQLGKGVPKGYAVQNGLLLYKGKNLALSTYEKELLALVIAVKRWRAYLVSMPFIFKIDQHSLKYLLEQKIGTPAQQKWFAKLLGYVFVVEYKKGKDNLVADALFRKADFEDCTSWEFVEAHKGVLCMVSFPSPAWLTDLKASYVFD